ncbi:MAG TPA: 16S rRNA (cytosine(967)-C(5))-methyltransferase RsmB, partial [Thiobacillaceae bacterium]|nr:16S rRNA (cytosine(967)-C(5))-methyltransferase RsmB [Thiobacillaceae bacterium]
INLPSPQALAAEVVADTLAGRTLAQALDATRLDPLPASMRGAVQDAAYGVPRYRGTLTAVLGQLVSRPLADRYTQALLLVCLYQLLYTRGARHAIVNNGVEAAPRKYRALVNAVLRGFQRQQEHLLSQARNTLEGRYNHPVWWVEKLQHEYPDQWDAILSADQLHPPLTLRINRRNATSEQVLADLRTAELPATQNGPWAITLDRPVPVARIPGFAEGRVSVQDAGAQWAAQLLDAQDGMRVLDACAAPGGKTGHLLELADVELLALDADEHRLERVQQNLERLQLSAELKTGDAARPDSWWNGRPFDRILADVPCSASGVVRRNPDIKWLRRPEDIPGFVLKQGQILGALWQTLAPGGKLLYATCSIFVEENENEIGAFLSQHENARRLDLPSALQLQKGQLLPNVQHDGFFYALLEKRA